MVRRAAALVGNDETAQREFILANVDQSEGFWMSVAELMRNETTVQPEHPQPPLHELQEPPPPTLRRDPSKQSGTFPASDAPSSCEWAEGFKSTGYHLLAARLAEVAAEPRTPGAWVGDLSKGDIVDVNAVACLAFSSGGHSFVSIPGMQPGGGYYTCERCRMMGPSGETGTKMCERCKHCEVCCTSARFAGGTASECKHQIPAKTTIIKYIAIENIPIFQNVSETVGSEPTLPMVC
jgi:hypothetical protein